jgi:hypothetical protein
LKERLKKRRDQSAAVVVVAVSWLCSRRAGSAAARTVFAGVGAAGAKKSQTQPEQRCDKNNDDKQFLHDQAGSTRMLAAVSSSKLRVPPLTLTMQ